jgi:nucleotide-binding universal stress UspA family protein
MRYLVATDGSTEGDDAVRYAAEHAVARDATLEIVTVVTPETELVDDEMVFSGDDEAIERGRRTLRQAEELAAETADSDDAELRVETELLAGRPAAAITDHAGETGTDTIFVGHRGLSEKREQVVGSVAKSVLDEAAVPVTIVK